MKFKLLPQLWEAVSIVFNREVVSGEWIDEDTFAVKFERNEVERRIPAPIVRRQPEDSNE